MSTSATSSTAGLNTSTSVPLSTLEDVLSALKIAKLKIELEMPGQTDRSICKALNESKAFCGASTRMIKTALADYDADPRNTTDRVLESVKNCLSHLEKRYTGLTEGYPNYKEGLNLVREGVAKLNEASEPIDESNVSGTGYSWASGNA
jgi:exonuclease VII small subunit